MIAGMLGGCGSAVLAAKDAAASVLRTLEIMNEQKEGLPVVIRPWIQDFGYGSFAPYSADQVRAEFKAASDNGAKGWMIWNARARFTEEALGAPRLEVRVAREAKVITVLTVGSGFGGFQSAMVLKKVEGAGR